ncbi:MAG: hypothetical protein WC533_01770 [Candidatus Pacearchaeota archaeon]
MEKTINNKTDNKKKAGRPKGAKSKLNLPIRNIADAIDWARKVDNEANGNEFHPEDLVEYIGINKGFVSPALSVLQKFGFIEKGSFGWKISDLGMRVISNEREAVREALERVDLYRDLLRSFGDKNVTKTIILNYLKTKYKKGENTEIIAEKYAEAVSYLNSLEKGIGKPATKEVNKIIDNKIITLLKLKYTFYPDKNSKKEILNELITEFNDDEDVTIKSLISQIKENEDNESILKVLIDTLMNSFSQKYPILNIEKKVKKEQKKEITEKSQEHHSQSD